MATQRQRTLAVILHADVVGSTALVQLDATLAHDPTFTQSGVARMTRGRIP